MLTYGTLLVFVLLASGLAAAWSKGGNPRLWPAVAAAVALVLVAGLRTRTGTDTGTYAYWFTEILPYQSLTDGKDPGFTLLCRGIRAVFGNDPMWMFLVCAALTVIPVVLTLRAYARPFTLGITLYVLTGTYFFAFNGVRQGLAGAIVLGGSRFLFERRWKAFFPIVLGASLFHASALIFVPAYFLATARVVSLRNIAVALGLGAFLVLYETLVPEIAAGVGSGRFGDYSDELLQQGSGAHWLRILVRLVIFAAAFVRRREIQRLFPSGGSILVNLSLISALLYLLSAKHWIYARVAFYPGMFEAILLPLLTRTFHGASRALVTFGICAAFLGYLVLLLLAGESNLLPYRSILD